VGPRAGLNAVANRKTFLPRSCLESNPGLPARSLAALLTGL